ncbi:MAG: hypothetical protein WAO61_05615 [Solirubrobacterales bacterium]
MTTPELHASEFTQRPATSTGRWAGRSCLIAIAAILAVNIAINPFENEAPGAVGDIRDVARATLGVIFVLSGFAALVLAARSLMARERSFVVWAALIIGVLVTTLMIAEFTVME